MHKVSAWSRVSVVFFFFDLKSRCFIQTNQAQDVRETKYSLQKQGGDPSKPPDDPGPGFDLGRPTHEQLNYIDERHKPQ